MRKYYCGRVQEDERRCSDRLELGLPDQAIKQEIYDEDMEMHGDSDGIPIE